MDDLFALASIIVVIVWSIAYYLKRTTKSEVLLKNAKAICELKSYFIALLVITVFRAIFYEMFWIPSASMQPTLREGEFVIVDKNSYGYKLPLVDVKLSEGRDPQRGEIVVFKYPLQDDVFYIKRIIAIPGDKLTINGNQIIINDNVADAVKYLGPANTPYIYEESRTKGLLGGVIDTITNKDPRKVRSDILWEKLPAVGWHPILVTEIYQAPNTGYNGNECRSSYLGVRLECIVPENSYFVMGDNRHRSNDSRYWGFVPKELLVGPAFAVAISLDKLSRSFTSLGLTANANEMDGLVPKDLNLDPYEEF